MVTLIDYLFVPVDPAGEIQLLQEIRSRRKSRDRLRNMHDIDRYDAASERLHGKLLPVSSVSFWYHVDEHLLIESVYFI